MNDPMPPRRLNARQLRALAASLRHHAGDDDATTDSVAAALESVSRRRAAREPLRLLSLAATEVQGASQRIASAWRARRELDAGLQTQSDTQAGTAPVSTLGSVAMSLDPSAIKQALIAVDNGSGLAPELCDALVNKGWLEWVHDDLGTPIDCNHPRSLLRMTAKARQYYGAVMAA